MLSNDQEREKAFQLVVTEWLPIIKNALRFYHVTGTDFDDLSQIVVCAVLEKRYDLVYDPARSKLSTFIYAMVRLRLRSFRNGAAHRKKDALAHSVFVGDRKWLLDKPDDTDEIGSREFWELAEKLQVNLSTIVRRKAVRGSSQSKTVRYTLGDIFALLAGGLSQAEIHRQTGYTEGNISMLMKIIREREDVQELRDHFTGLEREEKLHE